MASTLRRFVPLLGLASTALAGMPLELDAKYLITFGDSYSQTGFNTTLSWPTPSNPLGNPPLPGWTASGGLNWVGFLTSRLNTSLVLTYNFAYGGATTSSALIAPYEPTVLSFVDQIAEFNATIASHPAQAPWTSNNTLFGVWIGVNDVGNAWWESNATAIFKDVIEVYFEQLETLYAAGGRNFVLLNVPPINETPLVLNSTVAEQTQEADAIALYNSYLSCGLSKFTGEHADVVGKIVNTTAAFDTALADPQAYGAPDATCFNSDGTSCLWFNNYHPGIAINKLVAEEVAAAWNGTFF